MKLITLILLFFFQNFILNAKTLSHNNININEVEFTNNEFKVLKESNSSFFDINISSQQIHDSKVSRNESIMKNRTQIENIIALPNTTSNITSNNLTLSELELLNFTSSQPNMTYKTTIQPETKTEKEMNLSTFNLISNFSTATPASSSNSTTNKISTQILTPIPVATQTINPTSSISTPIETQLSIDNKIISNMNEISEKKGRMVKEKRNKVGKNSSVLISTLLSNLTRNEQNDRISWRIRNHLLNNSIKEEIMLRKDLQKMEANNINYKENDEITETKKCGDCEVLQNEKIDFFLKNDSCLNLTNCKECTGQKECGWCPKIGLCVGGDGEGPFYGKCEWYQYGLCKERCLKFLDCFSCITDRDCEWCISDQFSACADRKLDKNLLCKKIVPLSQPFCPKNIMVGKDQLNEELQVREWEQEIPAQISQKDENKKNLRDSLGILVDQSSIKKIITKKEEKIKRLKEAELKTESFFAGKHTGKHINRK